MTTERESNKIRIFSLPDLKAIDNGGIAVFDGEELRDPMGIALYTRKSDAKIFAIVGRKSGRQEVIYGNMNFQETGNLLRQKWFESLVLIAERKKSKRLRLIMN